MTDRNLHIKVKSKPPVTAISTMNYKLRSNFISWLGLNQGHQVERAVF